jgi:hypothetical protein
MDLYDLCLIFIYEFFILNINYTLKEYLSFIIYDFTILSFSKVMA